MTDVVLPDTVGGVVVECIVLGLISGSLSAGILTGLSISLNWIVNKQFVQWTNINIIEIWGAMFGVAFVCSFISASIKNGWIIYNDKNWGY